MNVRRAAPQRRYLLDGDAPVGAAAGAVKSMFKVFASPSRLELTVFAVVTASLKFPVANAA